MSNPDNLTKAGAEELAAKLDRYWHKRGATHVRHEVIKLGAIHGAEIFVVRSNLINGAPPHGGKNGPNS